jgi:hypothetical protein
MLSELEGLYIKGRSHGVLYGILYVIQGILNA